MSSRTASPFSPSCDDFQRTFAVDTFQKTLHMNKTETSWSFVHSKAAANPAEFPSPASSEYHLPLARRPKSAGMSQLTAKENRRLHIKTELHFAPASPKKASAVDFTSPTKTPTDNDFQRVMDKLQKLQVGNFGCKRIILTETKTENCVLDTNEIQYLKISTVNKLTPLKVMMKRSKGKAIVYMSKTISEPTELLADAIFTRDTFVITDTGIRFKFETVFLAIKALSPLSLSAQVKFGKRRITRSDSTSRGRFTRDISQDEGKWEAYRVQQEAKSPHNSTSFVRRNMILLPPSSPKTKFEAKVKKRISEDRRRSAMIRRKSLAEEKKQRVFLVLHKHEIREMEMKRLHLIGLQLTHKSNCEKDWLRLAANAGFLETAWRRYVDRRREMVIQEKQRKAAVKIQANFKRFVKGADKYGLALRSCRIALLLYSRHCWKYSHSFVHEKLGQVIKEAFENSIVTTAVRTCFRRVVMVQRRWRKFVEKRATRWDKLNSMWASSLDDILKHLSRASKSPKRGKKKRDPMPGYLHIAPELKDNLLASHLTKRKALFYERMKEYIMAQTDLLKRGIKALLAADSKLLLPAAPDFDFMPTKEEMKAMIDKAAKETLKAMKD